jgi:hypothetical protein
MLSAALALVAARMSALVVALAVVCMSALVVALVAARMSALVVALAVVCMSALVVALAVVRMTALVVAMAPALAPADNLLAVLEGKCLGLL